ncbi:hypothetical protein ACJW30_06G017900 [Castanea mollissima]
MLCVTVLEAKQDQPPCSHVLFIVPRNLASSKCFLSIARITRTQNNQKHDKTSHINRKCRRTFFSSVEETTFSQGRLEMYNSITHLQTIKTAIHMPPKYMQ